MAVPSEGGSATVYHSIPSADVDRDGPLPVGAAPAGSGEQQVLIQKEGERQAGAGWLTGQLAGSFSHGVHQIANGLIAATGTASLLSCISNRESESVSSVGSGHEGTDQAPFKGRDGLAAKVQQHER